MHMKTRPSLLSLSLCLSLLGAASAAEPQATVTVQAHAVALSFAADGVIEAQQQTEVAAQVSGRVLEVRVDAGQSVSKGQVLMRIDAREAAEAAAAAQAQYANAKANFERTARLVEQKFLSPAALDKSRAEHDAAAASRSAALAATSHAVIVAPISGTVARRHAELGDMAQPGKPLFTLFAPGALRATASVPQYQLNQVRGVKEAQVELPEQGRRVVSTRVTLLPTVDAGTHVGQVRVDLPASLSAGAAPVAPGMFVRVHFVTGQATKLTVPASAVVRRGELAAVYVKSADGRPSLRQLRLGEAAGNGDFEVLAGLASGEQVFLDPIRAAIAIKAGK